MLRSRKASPVTIVCVLLSILLLCGCGSPTADRADLDVQEAVLRWAFVNAETNLNPPVAYCLAVSPYAGSMGGESEDPDPALLARFAGDTVPVRPLAACQVHGGGVVDEATGGPGLLFVIGPVIEEAGQPVGAEVGYMQSGEVGAGWHCSVRRSTTGWSVTRCKRMVDI